MRLAAVVVESPERARKVAESFIVFYETRFEAKQWKSRIDTLQKYE